MHVDGDFDSGNEADLVEWQPRTYPRSMASERQLSWLVGIGCITTACATVEVGASLLGRSVPPLSFVVAMVLWLLVAPPGIWYGTRVVRQILRGVPGWAGALWLAAYIGAVFFVVSPWIPGLAALYKPFMFLSLSGLIFGLKSTLLAWARVRELRARTSIHA